MQSRQSETAQAWHFQDERPDVAIGTPLELVRSTPTTCEQLSFTPHEGTHTAPDLDNVKREQPLVVTNLVRDPEI